MSRAYNVVDADGHILEPLDLWDKYIDPGFRDRAPRIVTGENGKQCLVMDEHVVGNNQRGIGGIGGGRGQPTRRRRPPGGGSGGGGAARVARPSAYRPRSTRG